MTQSDNTTSPLSLEPNYIANNRLYHKIVFTVTLPSGKRVESGPGIYFFSKEKAGAFLKKRVVHRHPDAKIVSVQFGE